MAPAVTGTVEEWVSTLPAAPIMYPEKKADWLKYAFWRLYTPCHPYIRDLALSAGIVKHTGRQDYLLGRIGPNETVESFVAFLIRRGYGNHFIAWKDDNEIVSLRYIENFKYQYHIRIFEDGEVRGHYELTPEAHPIKHLQEIGQESRREEFLRLFGDRVVPYV